MTISFGHGCLNSATGGGASGGTGFIGVTKSLFAWAFQSSGDTGSQILV